MKGDRWLRALLALAAAVRLPGLGARSLSYDECQQFWASQGSPLISNREITLDPPGFACLLHLHAAAGRGEAWLRLLPCLFGVLAVAAVYRLAVASAGDRWTARAAAFFMALAPYPIRYSQSLRVYSLAMLCAAALVAAFLESTDEEGRRGMRDACLLGGLAFASLLSIYGSVWLMVILGGLLAWRGVRERGVAWRRSLIALAAGGTLAAPVYLLSLPTQLSEGTPASFYDDKFLPHAPWPALVFLIRGTRDLCAFFSFIHPATGLVFGALAILGAVSLRGRRGAALSIVFAGSLIAAAVASAFRLYPYGGTRQMLFAAPLFYVLCAAGIASLRPRLRGVPAAALLASIVAGAGIFLYRYHTEPGGQEMRPVVRWLEQAASPDDRILVNSDARPQFRFYYRGDEARVIEGRESVIRDYLSEANRLMAQAPQSRWWLVFSHGWTAERRRELEGIDPRFEAGERFEAYRAGAYLFVPRRATPPAGGGRDLP